MWERWIGGAGRRSGGGRVLVVIVGVRLVVEATGDAVEDGTGFGEATAADLPRGGGDLPGGGFGVDEGEL